MYDYNAVAESPQASPYIFLTSPKKLDSFRTILNDFTAVGAAYTFLSFMKKLQSKLSLNKETLSVLTAQEMKTVKGGLFAQPSDEGGDAGFLSIGFCCSCDHHCPRVQTKCYNTASC